MVLGVRISGDHVISVDCSSSCPKRCDRSVLRNRVGRASLSVLYMCVLNKQSYHRTLVLGENVVYQSL